MGRFAQIPLVGANEVWTSHPNEKNENAHFNTRVANFPPMNKENRLLVTDEPVEFKK